MAVDDIRSGPGVEARIEGIEGFPRVRVRARRVRAIGSCTTSKRVCGDPTGEGGGGAILGA